MSQYTELKAQIAKLQEQAEEARRAELEAVLPGLPAVQPGDVRRGVFGAYPTALAAAEPGQQGHAVFGYPNRESEIL